MGPATALAPLTWAFGSGGVVAYHDVTAAPFAPSMHITVRTLTEQLAFATQRYNVIPLSEFIARRQAGRSVRRCVALTFDDAYHGVREHALPLLERFALPATVFVTTGFARSSESGARYWWDRLHWVLEHATPGMARQLFSDLGLPGGSVEELRAAVMAADGGRLSGIADAALRAAERRTGLVPERPLGEVELRELARSDLIEFGCHTESHPVLPALSVDEQRREIAVSHAWLVERLPRVRRFLAYPYGLYDQRSAAAARDAGMDAAFSIEGRAGGPRFDLYACPRIGMAEAYGLRSFQLRLRWWTIPLVAWRNGGWHPRVPVPTTVPVR